MSKLPFKDIWLTVQLSCEYFISQSNNTIKLHPSKMHKYFLEKIQAKSLDGSFPFSGGTLLSSAKLMQIHIIYIQKPRATTDLYQHCY